ncbi:MAG: inositol monophosphatase family protein [Bacteroidota bacterium]
MDLKAIVGNVMKLTRETGAYIRQEARVFDHHVVEEKGLNDLVSYVDKTAEERLVTGLRNILPEAGFIAEEGTAASNNEKYKWIIDPLDGTTNFTHGLPVYAISIALIEEDELVIGVVYEINKNEMFWAVKGEGAWLNDERIHVSARTSLSESLLATGFPYYNFEQMQAYLMILNDFMKGTHGLRRMGSAAVDLAYVACGRFEGFFEYNLNAWDVAAGSLLVKEAGGAVTDFSLGSDYLYGKEIIAAGPILEEMHGVIAKYWN